MEAYFQLLGYRERAVFAAWKYYSWWL